GAGSSCSYCEAKAGDSSAGYISRVRIHDTRLDVRSDWGDGSGYSDFTTGYTPGMGKLKSKGSYFVEWADVHRGRVYRIDIHASSLGQVRPANFHVYIDWDHDGEFDSQRDLVATGWSRNFVSADFVVPRNAPLGSTRMRVVMAGGRTPTP